MLGYALWCVFLDMGESQQQVKQLGSTRGSRMVSLSSCHQRRSSSKETHFTAAQQVAASS